MDKELNFLMFLIAVFVVSMAAAMVYSTYSNNSLKADCFEAAKINKNIVCESP